MTAGPPAVAPCRAPLDLAPGSASSRARRIHAGRARRPPRRTTVAVRAENRPFPAIHARPTCQTDTWGRQTCLPRRGCTCGENPQVPTSHTPRQRPFAYPLSRAVSSVGQSASFTPRRSLVRVQYRPPHQPTPRLPTNAVPIGTDVRHGVVAKTPNIADSARISCGNGGSIAGRQPDVIPRSAPIVRLDTAPALGA